MEKFQSFRAQVYGCKILFMFRTFNVKVNCDLRRNKLFPWILCDFCVVLRLNSNKNSHFQDLYCLTVIDLRPAAQKSSWWFIFTHQKWKKKKITTTTYFQLVLPPYFQLKPWWYLNGSNLQHVNTNCGISMCKIANPKEKSNNISCT